MGVLIKESYLRNTLHILLRIGLLLILVAISGGCGILTNPNEEQGPSFTGMEGMRVSDTDFRQSEAGVGGSKVRGYFLTSSEYKSVFAIISGCSSGFTRSLKLESEAFDLYRFDENCVVSILNFELGGQVYVIPDGESFNTDVNSETEFVSQTGKKALVRVLMQLPAKILNAQNIFQVRIIQIDKEKDHNISIDQNIVSIAEMISPGNEKDQRVLRFKIYRVTQKPGTSLNVSLVIGGTATEGSDYTIASTSVNLAKGEYEKTVEITILDDFEPEPEESIVLAIADSKDYLHYNTITLLIDPSDNLPVTSDLVFWYSSFSLQGLPEGSRLSQWEDYSPHQNSGTQNKNAYKPLISAPLSPSDLKGVAFDGVNDFLTVSNSSPVNIASDYEKKTFYLVFKTGSEVTNTQVLYKQGGQSRGLNFYIENSSLNFSIWNLTRNNGDPETPWGVTSASIPVFPDTFYIVRGEYDYPSKSLSLTDHFQQLSKVPVPGRLYRHTGKVQLGGIDTATLLSDGSGISKLATFSGSFSAVISYNSVHTPAESEQMLQTLAERYSIITN